MKMKNVTVFVIFLFALLWINFWYVCCYLKISFHIYVFFWPIRSDMLYIHYINSWKVKFIHKVIPASYWHLHLIFFITYLTENIPNLVLIWERERRTIIQVWYKCSNVLLSHFISFWYWYIISKFGLVFRCVIFTAQ